MVGTDLMFGRMTQEYRPSQRTNRPQSWIILINSGFEWNKCTFKKTDISDECISPIYVPNLQVG